MMNVVCECYTNWWSELVQGDRQVAVIKGRSACHRLRHQGRNRPVSRFVECILDIRLILLYTR